MDYSIFGPLSVRVSPDEPPLELAEKPALLLARLLVEPGTAIPASTLTYEIWGEGAVKLKDPDNSLQRVVAQLRQRLGDTKEPRQAIVLSGSASYRLLADPVSIDTERFRLLARWGHRLAGRATR
jgi:DNA-binding response OmpR family regulator